MARILMNEPNTIGQTVFEKPLIQSDGGEGCCGMAIGYPVTMPGEEAALSRLGTAKARGNVQNASQSDLMGCTGNTRQSSLSMTS